MKMRIKAKTIFFYIIAAHCCAFSAEISREDVLGAMEKSARYHMSNMQPSKVEGRSWHIPELPARVWHTGAYYDGMIELSRVTGNPIYWSEVLRHGYSVGWTANPGVGKRLYHADDHAVGHAWLETYLVDKSRRERLEPFKNTMSSIIEASKTFDIKSRGKDHGTSPVNTWTWCDALYMAPPTLVRLYAATSDRKFLDYMNREFEWCQNTLYSDEDKLFYRDADFIGRTSPSGKKIFWSRGNGWVLGGLAQILQFLPKDEPSRKSYENLYTAMAEKVASLQGEDGLWRVNLADPEHYKGGETSGSGFFTYAIAWGINNGLLDRDKYLPIAIKGWKGLLTRVRPDGMVGYVQPVGSAPDSFTKDTTHAYGVGAFLLAGSEIARALGMAAKISDSQLLRRAEAIYAAKSPKAYAHIEPRRKDDIAWENDKMAFRAYGPALQDSIENSGIDVWCKSVSYPVIDKWYADDLSGIRSYHKDNGEGLDAFTTADSVGLGGTGIWRDGKLWKSNVYKMADVIWQTEENIKIVLVYHYDIGREKYTEIKTITLSVGDDACSATSIFLKGHKYWHGTPPQRDFAEGIEVAAGIYAQDKEAKSKVDKSSIYLEDKLANKTFRPFIISISEADRAEVAPLGDSKEYLLIMKTGKDGKIQYKFGYTWNQ